MKEVLQKILLISIGLIAALAMLEVSVRLLLNEEYDYPIGLYQADATRGYRLTPNFCGRHRQINGDFDVEYCIDGNGYRKTENKNSLSATQLLFLGDSFTFGVGVNDAEVFPAVTAAHTGMTVLNAGISGYDLRSEELLLRQLLAQEIHPRMLIVQIYLGNDLLPLGAPPAIESMSASEGILLSKGSLTAANALTFERRLRRTLRSYGFIISRISQFLPGSALYHVRGDAPSTQGIIHDKNHTIAQRFEQDLRSLQKTYYSAIPDGKLLLLIIPTKLQVEPLYRKEICDRFQLCPSDLELLSSHQLVTQIAADLDVTTLDCYQHFIAENHREANHYHFYHNDHWTAAAHRSAAELIIKQIEN